MSINKIICFNKTKRMYKRNAILANAIKKSIQNQEVVYGTQNLEVTLPQKGRTAEILVTKSRSLAAAKRYSDSKVCVLNFASPISPGGGVTYGASAQEECICRVSTLYPCLQSVKREFYQKHFKELISGKMDDFYNNDCIYTPGVVVFKTDTANPEFMEPTEWYKVNVISCAAPNLSGFGKRINMKKGDIATDRKVSRLLSLHILRAKAILDLAYAKGNEVVILGAFGCGAFRNPPDIVAEACQRVIQDYRFAFRTIEFAVYCSERNSKNFDTFKRFLL